MKNLEEQSTPFSTEIQNVAKGINRIRYLKTKINKSYCLLKGLNVIDDERQCESTIPDMQNSRLGGNCLQKTKRLELKTVQSQRFNLLKKKGENSCSHITYLRNKNQKKQHKFKQSKKQRQYFAMDSKKSKNDNFEVKNEQDFVKAPLRQSRSDRKLDTFYYNFLLKNIKSHNQNQNITLQQVKKINYQQIKRQKQQRKVKLRQQKQNEFRQILMRKEKVKLQEKVAQNRIFLFLKQKDEDLRQIKKNQKQLSYQRLNAKIKKQLQLEQVETQRLKNIEDSLVIKQNLKRLIQTQMNTNRNKERNLQFSDIQNLQCS